MKKSTIPESFIEFNQEPNFNEAWVKTAGLSEIQDVLWEQMQKRFPQYDFRTEYWAIEGDPRLNTFLNSYIIVALSKVFQHFTDPFNIHQQLLSYIILLRDRGFYETKDMGYKTRCFLYDGMALVPLMSSEKPSY